MSSAPWDPRGEALSALRMIAADPQHGTEALSSPQMMANLLKDMLPDAPREASVLIAAAEAGVPAALQGYVARGMDVGTASQLAAGALADRTALTAEACAWAAGSMAATLLTPAVPPVVPASAAAAGTAYRDLSEDLTMAAQGAAAGTGPEVMAGGPGITIPGPAPASRAPGRLAGLGLLAAALAGAGALATILACGFSYAHIFNSDGTYAYSVSLFSITSQYGGAWHWTGPVVTAALSAAAALVLVLSRTSWRRAAAAGVIAAFGAAIILFFAAYEFTIGPVSAGAGPAGAEKLGAFGGLLLLVAGLLGMAAAARDR
jgi:hypothetical protein